jgi:hypothetical protein
LGLDFPQALVYNHCRTLLHNLIHSLITARIEAEVPDYYRTQAYAEALALGDYLRSKEGRMFWPRDPRTSATELASLVKRLVGTLADKYSGLEEAWASEALSWAISCPNVHLRSRSLQIFRSLSSVANSDTIGDLLHSLLKCKLNSTAENCSIVIEILTTLEVMVDNMVTNKLVLFNQIFWAAVALLHTDFEEEYVLALTLLSKIVSRVNFNDTAVQVVFLASQPKTWHPPFIGIQPLVLRGLLSAITEPSAIALLLKLTLLPLDEIFQPGNMRWICTLLALTPHLSTQILQGNAHEKHAVAEELAVVCERKPAGIKLTDVYTQIDAYATTYDFLDAWAAAFASLFFPTHALYTLTFIVELLVHGPEQYQHALLLMLQVFMKHIDVTLPQVCVQR